MKTFLSILGVLFLLGIAMFIGFRKGLLMNFFGQTPKDPGLDECDPMHIGFKKDGTQASKCNTVVSGNCIDGCDKNNPTHDCNGFFDPINCSGDRKAEIPTVTESEIVEETTEQVTTSGERNTASSEVSGLDYKQIETTIATKVNMNPRAVRAIQSKYGLYASGVMDNRTRTLIANNIQRFVKIVTTNPEVAFPTNEYCKKNWQYAPYDCFMNWIFG